MTEPLLSILIPTVVGREKEFANLMFKLSPISWYIFQTIDDGYSTVIGGFYVPPKGADLSDENLLEYSDHVELLAIKDNKEHTIGEKRELLYKKSKGLYSIQLDDDDSLADNAIELILEAIKQEPDVITFEEYCNINGKELRSNHSLVYDDWHDNFDGYDFVRTPFFKSVIRTSIAQSVPIPHIRWSEDHEWSKVLKPHLHTEVHIPEQLYRYIHVSSDPTERYGLDK